MITLYGKDYAANEVDLDVAIAEGREAINGTYVKTPAGIYLADMTGRQRAFIRHDGLGPVSIAKLSDGKTHYMHATSTHDEEWLGTPKSYMEEVDGARSLAREMFA